MNLKSVRAALLILILFPICAFASPKNAELMYAGAKSQYVSLFSSPKKMADRGEWLNSINRFRLIVKNNPSSPRASEAQYYIGLLYKNMYRHFGVAADKNESIAAFSALISKYPRSKLVPSARRHIGDMRFMSKENGEAVKEYKTARGKKAEPKAAPVAEKKKPVKEPLEKHGKEVLNKQASAETKAPAAATAVPKAAEEKQGEEVASVVSLRRYSNGGYTRIVLDLSDSTAYRAERDANSSKLFIDLMDTKVSSKVSAPAKFENGAASGVSFIPGDGFTRVAIDLAETSTTHSVLALPNPARIVIDLNKAKPAEPAPAPEVAENSAKVEPSAKPAESAAKAEPPAKPAREISEHDRAMAALQGIETPRESGKEPAKESNKEAVKETPKDSPKETARPSKEARSAEDHKFAFKPRKGYTASYTIKTIVIDPGHGGKDPGAIGPTGLKEKDAALAIAKELKIELERRLSCRVVLTRTTDKFLELDERTVLANSLNADLFVSIHLNASPNPSARGIETYFMSPSRSKDELATAARENMLALKSHNETENDLAYIMSDLINTQKVNESSQLAETVQTSVVKGMKRHNNGVKDKGVKQAMFYVLWRATMPSILVESGFISNREEEKRFRNSEYIAELAKNIANGLENYNKTYVTAANGG